MEGRTESGHQRHSENVSQTFVHLCRVAGSSSSFLVYLQLLLRSSFKHQARELSNNITIYLCSIRYLPLNRIIILFVRVLCETAWTTKGRELLAVDSKWSWKFHLRIALSSVSVTKMWKKTTPTNRGIIRRLHRQTTTWTFPASSRSRETLAAELSVHRLDFGDRGSEIQKVAKVGLILSSNRSVEGARIGGD
jgi:hypothetical protein